MKKWKNTGDTMGKYRCLTLNDKGSEKCLSGPRGEIWEAGQGGSTYKAVVFTSTGQEKIYSFNSKQLPAWVKRLEVPVNPDDQLQYANNFGRVL